MEDGSVPVGIRGEALFVAVRAGAFEGHEIGEGNATDEDALVSSVDGEGAADGEEGGEVGLVDVDGGAVAEGCVAEVVAGAGGEK